jgi:hypothetical protein
MQPNLFSGNVEVINGDAILGVGIYEIEAF